MKYWHSITLLLLGTIALSAADWPPAIDRSKDEATIDGRALEIFQHGVKPKWGYSAAQNDTFVVVHPKTDRENAPLYVVLHSAGHDVFSAVNCTKTVGNHDIYRSPDDHYALYLDCRKNKGNDWWWGGMHRGDKGLIAKNSGSDTTPVEKRVMDTVGWVIKHYKIDPNRVYLSGNSMGASGTLGIGMRHGNVFAAIKANVPAGVEHVAERLFLSPKSIPEGVILPDPPICIDYSAQNDGWSVGHGGFARAMNERKYPFIFYWGAFGHANNSAKIVEVNDLIDSYDWLSVKKNEAYPVFANASTNSDLPWPNDLKSADAGQINAFFRWKLQEDTAQALDISLFLVSAEDLETTFEIPEKASSDVSLRRLQNFKLTPGAAFRWQFGSAQGDGKVDAQGLITVAGLTITSKPTTLRILSEEKQQATTAHEPDARLHADGKGWRLDKAKITDPERPRVLLIGDSILNGYFKNVVAALAGKAYVDAWVNPHWQSEGTNQLLADVLTNNGHYDVVHFNMGLHGWPEGRIKAGTFEPLTKAYIDVLRAKLPKAKLIWASSTPVTAEGNPAELEPEINPIIIEHNRMAAKVMEEARVPVNDFYALLDTKRDLAKGDRFHWTGPAYKLLGKKTADSILHALAPAEKIIDFASDIKPILERSCTQCHANGKRKGGFSIDHIHAFIAGGESGPAVVSGKSAESLLIELVLSKDPDERMPSKGDALTLDEVGTLRAWIDQGLPWEKGFTFAKSHNAPVEPRLVVLPQGSESNPVDRLLASYLKKHEVDPDTTISDAVFARRVFLDTIGLLPTPVELETFLADERSDKRARLVADLLADDQNYSAHWFTFWSDCLRNSMSRSYHGGGGKQITDWLKESLAKNKPYDQFVRELIDPAENSSGFIKGVAWRGTVNASQVTEMQAAQNVAQVFLGLNIKCASCHDSFINDWTLKQTYAFASIFADQPMDIHRCDKPLGEKAEPSFLYPKLGAIDPAAPKAERVKQLSEIMTSPENGRLARTMVNRLWAMFFGRGIVEPVDEMDNPAWNQDLLDWLAVDLVHHGYDLKHTMTLLLTSQAYQRTAVTLDPDADDFVFHGPVVRRMSAEQFLDSIDQVIAAAGDRSEEPRGTGQKRWGLRKIEPLTRTLGRTKRDVVVTQRESVATTAQLIELSNGKALAATMLNGGKAWLDSGKESDAMVEALFVHTLGRMPAEAEKESAREIVGTPAAAQGIEDLLWMLAMHPEFQLIY